MSRNVAVVAAHPDDEVLGCGGTIAKHAATGDRVHVLILAEGATSRDDKRSAESRKGEIDSLRMAANHAASILGIESVTFGGFPDNRMDGCDLLDVIKVVESFFQEKKPDIIYTHHAGDMNIDHWVTQRAVATALRPIPGAKFSRVLYFEVPSSTEWGAVACSQPFVPQWFEDISSYLPQKVAALNAYRSEMRSFPHPRSVENVAALATTRGATVGALAAEAFVLGWQVNRLEQ